MPQKTDFNSKDIALLCIDVQKVYDKDELDGKFEPWVAWQFKEVGQRATQVLNACREKGYNIIHLALCLDEHTTHPYDELDEEGKPIYSVKGTLGGEIIDSMKPQEGEIYIEKQRWSGFYGTNLDIVLKKHGIKHLIVVGGFTDACVLHTVYDAWERDYKITIVKDAMTAGSEGAHKAAVLTMANWVLGCDVFTTEELVKALRGEEYKAWFYETSHTLLYDCKNIDELYNKLG